MEKLVSIIMPTYNRVNLIGRAIESVLKQSYSNWELFIVDDYGNDTTEEFIKQKYRDNTNIMYLKNKGDKGPAGARNYALTKARGSYLAFLDSDDEWLSEHLCIGIKMLEESNKKVFFGNWLCDNGDSSLEQYVKEDSLFYKNVIKKNGNKLNDNVYFFKRNFIEYMTINMAYFYHINTLIFSSDLINEVGFFDKDLKASEDLDFTARMIEKQGFIFDLNPHFIYHIGTDNIYNFVDHSELSLEQLLFDQDKMRKIVTCDINKCNMLEKRKRLVKGSLYVVKKRECIKACNQKLAIKYFSVALLLQREDRKKSLSYLLQSIRYEFRIYKIYVMLMLFFSSKNKTILARKEHLNFI